MSCTKCQQTKPCTTTTTCACEVYLNSDCVNNVKTEFECLDIASGLNLTETLKAMDEQFCVKFDTITNYFTLINLGSGEEVYKGVNNLGQKEFKTLVKTGDLITIASDANTVIIGLDETALNDYIEANQKLTVVANAGDVGETLVKSPSTTEDTTTYFIKRLIHSSQDGEGESFVRDLQSNTDDITLRTKKVKSNTLSVTSTDEEIIIDTPMSAQIPALYVNDLHEPTYEDWLAENKSQNSGVAISGFEFIGRGTIAQPFTDTTVYPLLGGSPTITTSSAIQNALDGDEIYSFVGAGDRLNPEKAGQKIIVQNNNSAYTFSGNLNYSRLYLENQGIVNSTTTGFLVDMDDSLSFNETDNVTIFSTEGAKINGNGLGFNNSGTDVDTNNTSVSKRILLLGEKGEINFTENVSPLTRYVINADIGQTGNHNDGLWMFEVSCNINADYQGLVQTGGTARVVSFGGKFRTGSVFSNVNTLLKAFYLQGGSISFDKNSSVVFYGNLSTTREQGFSLIETSSFVPKIDMSGCSVFGSVENLFVKESTGGAVINIADSGDKLSLSVVNVFESPDLWSVNFKSNSMASGVIDFTKADLTQGNVLSSINFIGSNVIETLVTYNSKELARVALSTNSAFLLQRDIDASDLVAGNEYKIKVAGTGTPLGTVGTYFIATGLESAIGGVATLIERAIVL